jgi:L-ascorbate metabolism protein UlaG (beta-lactamase superfamily)
MHPLTTIEVAEGHVAIHWFEQSSFALKDSYGTIVQIDPYFPQNRPAERFIHPEPPLDESQLPTDYVLLTHAHGDHTWPESIERIWRTSSKTRFIGPVESIAQIRQETTVPEDNVVTIQAGGVVALGEMTAHAVYAKPPQGDPAANISPPDVTHLGYVIKAEGVTLYVSGDPINTFAEHEALIQAVASHKPDIGFLTNHPSEGEFPFYDGCLKMAQRIGLSHAVPAHRACFVKRDYDPAEWAAHFPAGGPQPLIIPRNSHIIYPLV